MFGRKRVQLLACLMLVIVFGSLAFGLPADSSIKCNSTCSLTGMTTEISLLVKMTKVNSVKPHHLHGGCLNFLLDRQNGSHPYRLICASFGQVVTSNSCISYNKPPMKDLCRNVVQTLQFNETKDGFARLTVSLKDVESISGKMMRLSFESITLSYDPACDFECTVTSKTYTTPGEPTTPTINTTDHDMSSEILLVSTSSTPTKGESLTSGKIAAIVLASVAVVVLVGVVLFCWLNRP